MIRRRLAIGLGAFGVLMAGAFGIGTNGKQTAVETKQFVTVSGSAVNDSAQVRSETRAPKLGPSGLSHETPPPLEALRDYSHAQSVYDQEAKPGDFVTPPAVSVAH